ncbi:MAG: hypothetical protein WA040_07325 [Anaerolineae bacterium]
MRKRPAHRRSSRFDKTAKFWHPWNAALSLDVQGVDDGDEKGPHTVLAALLALSLLLNPLAQSIDPPWHAATPLPARGEVTFYGRGVMETVYHLRLERAQVPYCDRPACVGYIATLRPGDLGRKVWLDVPGIGIEGPFLVVDYAAARDFERLRRRGLIAEVDYVTAQRWAMRRPAYDVIMLAEPPLVMHRQLLPLVVVGR